LDQQITLDARAWRIIQALRDTWCALRQGTRSREGRRTR
jgi:hypothetical protein